MNAPIRLFLIYDRLLTKTRREAFNWDPNFTVVDESNRPETVAKRVLALDIQVVVLEAGADRSPVRPLIRALRAACPRTAIVVMGLQSDDDTLECLEAGASGYVRFRASHRRLVETIHQVLAGEPPCDDEMTADIFDRVTELLPYDTSPEARRRALHFRPREWQVLKLVLAGHTNDQISYQLGLARSTVKNNVHRILEKLGVSSRREAIRMSWETDFFDSLEERWRRTGASETDDLRQFIEFDV